MQAAFSHIIQPKAEKYHSHEIEDIKGLNAKLQSIVHKQIRSIVDIKSNIVSSLGKQLNDASKEIENIKTSLKAKHYVKHTHNILDITDLQDTLNDINSKHNILASSVNSQNISIQSKADKKHTHSIGDIV